MSGAMQTTLAAVGGIVLGVALRVLVDLAFEARERRRRGRRP